MLTLYELAERDVISVPNGIRLGHVDDVEIDDASALITHIIIYGRGRLFGLLGREEDTKIPWQDIQKIGRDVVLVKTSLEREPKKHHRFFTLFD